LSSPCERLDASVELVEPEWWSSVSLASSLSSSTSDASSELDEALVLSVLLLDVLGSVEALLSSTSVDSVLSTLLSTLELDVLLELSLLEELTSLTFVSFMGAEPPRLAPTATAPVATVRPAATAAAMRVRCCMRWDPPAWVRLK
jgi:hypothetical protein